MFDAFVCMRDASRAQTGWFGMVQLQVTRLTTREQIRVSNEEAGM